MADTHDLFPSHPHGDQDSEGTIVIQRAHLTVYLPDGASRQYTLVNDVTRVGRGANNQVPLPDEYMSISRKHLEIRSEGDAYRILDLDSANGVLCNDQKIVGSAWLQDGDEIRIGLAGRNEQVCIVFHAGSEALLQHMAHAARVSPEPPPAPPKVPTERAYLRMRWLDGQEISFPLEQEMTLLGRSPDAGFRFPTSLRYVSNHHAEIWRTSAGYQIVDLHSTNGTRVDNQPLVPGKPTPLHDGAVIRIGDEDLGVSVGVTFHDPAEQKLPVEGFHRTTYALETVGQAVITIGRALDCDLVLESPQVSRHHARFEFDGDRHTIVDLNSLNGTFVNDRRVTSAQVESGDLIGIGQHILLFQDGQLTRHDSYGMRLDAIHLGQEVRTLRGSRRILEDVSMTVLPREFVALVGGSGAGKTTLMNALIGYRPGTGTVKLNGQDFYEENERFRAQLGYVPQSDILHTTLTVERALDYAARLRLPADVSRQDRKKRINQVLETVSMNTDIIRKTRISNLSGGQRKRVSIAAELLADPKLFFLDEATSGLDPGLEKKMMYTLRRMADEGRTVILITHATANIVQVDLVAFLSQGKLVYVGPPQEALGYFDVDEFADVYERIVQRGDEWQDAFRNGQPEYHERYVVERQKTIPPVPAPERARTPRFGIRDHLRQLGVLTQRAMHVLTSDLFTLALLLVLFPMTAVLQLIMSTPDILTGNLSIVADPVAAALSATESYIPFPNTNTFVFVMGLEAVLIGMYVPSNELIKERTIYLRERMVNLKILPYLLSKVAVFVLFAVIQCVLYLLVLSTGVDLPAQGVFFPGPVELFITLFLTMMAAVGIGLLVSSLCTSSEMAIYVLVLMMFFQFFFAGTVFDLRDNPAEPISYLSTTRWSLIALGTTIDIEQLTESTILCSELPPELRPPGAAPTQCYHYPEAREDLMLPYGKEHLLIAWGVLVAMGLLTIGLTGIFIKRLDKT